MWWIDDIELPLISNCRIRHCLWRKGEGSNIYDGENGVSGYQRLGKGILLYRLSRRLRLVVAVMLMRRGEIEARMTAKVSGYHLNKSNIVLLSSPFRSLYHLGTQRSSL